MFLEVRAEYKELKQISAAAATDGRLLTRYAANTRRNGTVGRESLENSVQESLENLVRESLKNSDQVSLERTR